MAVDRELFSILQTGVSGEGSAPTKKSVGNTVTAAIEVPVLPAQDSASNFQHIPVRDVGETVPDILVPTLGAKDSAGFLQQPDVRAEGSANGTENNPVLPARDAGGLLRFLKVNAAGELLVDSSGGDALFASAEATSVVGTYVDVATITLAVSTMYSLPLGQGSCSFLTSWRLVQKNDATETILARGMSGPGDFSWENNVGKMMFTSGASGTQSLILRGKQEHGSAQVAGLYGNVTVIEG